MKISRLEFYGSVRGVFSESTEYGTYCRISDLPLEIQEKYFDPIPQRQEVDDEDDE